MPRGDAARRADRPGHRRAGEAAEPDRRPPAAARRRDRADHGAAADPAGRRQPGHRDPLAV
ncbi:hypothetical protein C5F48_22420 [Cereibacter changlensis JA139]|uniref:Uncharacterized protein n=1 Tax=Cereibacter changlensis JA139 TaxID=1188249 RepID=A0A2T4JNP3_9RHOB|nr:hypothetical protein C5F48_22420 [Cereibacter changlensis JA139]